MFTYGVNIIYVYRTNSKIYTLDDVKKGQVDPWLYGSWIYNYLFNQYISPLKLWVRTPFMVRCTR